MMTPSPEEDLILYLRRLGHGTPPAPTLSVLGGLQARHTQVFPFETLAALLRVPVRLDLPSLRNKLLREGRGGYCYELNLMFLWLLRALGYDARPLTGRVLLGEDTHTPPPRTHMLILVTLDQVRYAVDVGFGGMVPPTPLRLDETQAQATPLEPYRLEESGGGYLLQAQVGQAWRHLYAFDLLAQPAIDFEVGNWYVSTHPESPFLGQLLVARTGPGERHALRNGEYAHHRIGQPSERHTIKEVAALRALLTDVFGLVPPAHPGLDAALARVL